MGNFRVPSWTLFVAGAVALHGAALADGPSHNGGDASIPTTTAAPSTTAIQSGNAADPTKALQLMGIDDQFRQENRAAEEELRAARMALAQCDRDKARNLNDIAAQQQQKQDAGNANALQNMIPSLGQAAQGAMGNAGQGKEQGEQSRTQIVKQTGEENVGFYEKYSAIPAGGLDAPAIPLFDGTPPDRLAQTKPVLETDGNSIAWNKRNIDNHCKQFSEQARTKLAAMTDEQRAKYKDSLDTLVRSCEREAESMRDWASQQNPRLQQANNSIQGGNDLLNSALPAAMGALGSLGSKMMMDKAAEDGAKAAKQNAALDYQACLEQANERIRQAQAALDEAGRNRERNLLRASLEDALKERLRAEGVASDDLAATLGALPKELGAAEDLGSGQQKPQALASANAGPGGGSGGGGGGGGPGVSAPAWTYGDNGGDNSGGGGLPGQPDGANFKSSGGGGGGGGFGFGDGLLAGFGAGAGDQAFGPGAGGGRGGALGDGGLRILMARASRVLANHARELARSVDLKDLAKAAEKRRDELRASRKPSAVKAAEAPIPAPATQIIERK